MGPPGRLGTILRALPLEIYSKAEAEALIAQSIEPLCRNEATRAQLDEVLRLMSSVLSQESLEPSEFYGEVQRCSSPEDMARTRLSKAVRLQAEVEALSTRELRMESLNAESYEFTQDFGNGATPYLVSASLAQKVLQGIPTMVILPKLEEVVMRCLQFAFDEVVKGSRIGAMNAHAEPLSSSGVPPEKLLQSCVKCNESTAKPAAAWVKGSGGEDNWPSTAPTRLACDILQMLRLRKKAVPVCVSPLLSSDAASDGGAATVEDLEALEQVLKLFGVIGKIGCLLAWVRLTFFRVPRPEQFASEGHINPGLDKALIAAKTHQEKAQLMVGGATAAVAELRCFAWAFPLHRIGDWVACTEAAHAAVCSHAMGTTVEQLLCKSLEVAKLVPNYDYMFNGRSLDLELCNRYLVRWPSKKALGQGCYALEQAIAAASKARELWGFSAPVEEHADYGKSFSNAENNYLTAKKAIATIAGCNCLANMRGKEQTSMRDSLKAKEQYKHMPALLVKQLEALK